MGGGRGIFEPQDFFSSSNSLYEFFLGYSMNIFLGLIGVQEFFFFYPPPPPPPPLISFLMVRPLQGIIKVEVSVIGRAVG